MTPSHHFRVGQRVFIKPGHLVHLFHFADSEWQVESISGDECQIKCYDVQLWVRADSLRACPMKDDRVLVGGFLVVTQRQSNTSSQVRFNDGRIYVIPHNCIQLKDQTQPDAGSDEGSEELLGFKRRARVRDQQGRPGAACLNPFGLLWPLPAIRLVAVCSFLFGLLRAVMIQLKPLPGKLDLLHQQF